MRKHAIYGILLFFFASLGVSATYLTGDAVRSPDRTKTWTMPAATGTLATLANSESFTNKTWAIGSNTFTGQLTVANGGTGLASGTSGGIPYFSGSTTIASSGALTANGVVLGGGAGTTPTATAAGSSNQVLQVPSAGGAPAFGPYRITTAAKTANYTATSADEFISVSTASGAVTITLPAVASNPGKRYLITKVNSSDNLLIVDANSTETINNQLTWSLWGQYSWLEIQSNGSEWIITGFKDSWNINANIAGSANISLGSSNVASYARMALGSLTVTKNAGAPVGISCEGSTHVVGNSNCNGAGDNEANGITFNVLNPGLYRACTSFTHMLSFTGGAGEGAVGFTMVETVTTSATTILQSSEAKVASRLSLASGEYSAKPITLCGNFIFSTSGQKSLMLYYEQVNMTNISQNVVQADAASTYGQPDIHWEVYQLF